MPACGASQVGTLGGYISGHSWAFTAAVGEEMGGGVALGCSLLPGWKHPAPDVE